MCAPSLDPPQLHRRQSFVIRKSGTAIVPAAVIPPHFLDAENAFPEGKEDPPHSSLASSLETPVWVHNTNATADMSPCNGISAVLSEPKACPDRDDNERTRPVITPSVRTLQPIRPHFVPLDMAHGAYDASLTQISDDIVLFWLPPSPVSQWTPSPFTVDLLIIEYDCAEKFTMASKVCLFGDDLPLSAILATDDPREQEVLDCHVRHFDHDFWQQKCETFSPPGQPGKILPNKKMRLALVLTGQRRIPEASPHDKLWGIGLSAYDPESTNASTVKCTILTTISCKKIANISSREATLRHSHKKMRYALPLDILANAASPKLALMINCSAPA